MFSYARYTYQAVGAMELVGDVFVITDVFVIKKYYPHEIIATEQMIRTIS